MQTENNNVSAQYSVVSLVWTFNFISEQMCVSPSQQAAEESHFVLIAGEPIHEPVVQHGSGSHYST